MKSRSDAGFTLIELMIVIEIIAIICAMAIPTLMRQRVQTNEAAAVNNLRTICTAEIQFNTSHLRYGSFADLTAGVGGAGAFLDSTWKDSAVRSEYLYTMSRLGNDTFTVTASPVVPGRGGIRTYWVDETGDINYR